jgi:hypothetical protein
MSSFHLCLPVFLTGNVLIEAALPISEYEPEMVYKIIGRPLSDVLNVFSHQAFARSVSHNHPPQALINCSIPNRFQKRAARFMTVGERGQLFLTPSPKTSILEDRGKETSADSGSENVPLLKVEAEPRI